MTIENLAEWIGGLFVTFIFLWAGYDAYRKRQAWKAKEPKQPKEKSVWKAYD